MIPYFIKFVLSSSLLFLLYFLFLEKEKMYHFNRFYLLFSIVFSFVIPFISIKIKTARVPVYEPVFLNDTSFQSTGFYEVGQTSNNTNIVGIILLTLYFILCTYLLYRYLRNVILFWNKARKAAPVSYNGAKIILTTENHYPFSFLNFIFVNGNDFRNKIIEDEILKHELAHINQKHSFDILFIELILIFAWLNPVLFLYKRAIQLNHEFLADEAVIKTSGKIKEYQYLLINKSDKNIRYLLSSTFNFLPIKKRIIMMNKNVSHPKTMVKKLAFAPLVVLIAFLFAFKIEGQIVEPIAPAEQIKPDTEGVSTELLIEYQSIIDRHTKLLKNGKSSVAMNEFTSEEKERMQEIFNKMTKEQRLNQKWGFIPANTMFLKKVVLTEEQLELYKDSKMYGVWIDNKRVKNEVLNNYKNTDFEQMNVSKLMKNAINYGKHYYQVNLMTTDFYRNYKNVVMDREGVMLVPIKMYEKMTTD